MKNTLDITTLLYNDTAEDESCFSLEDLVLSGGSIGFEDINSKPVKTKVVPKKEEKPFVVVTDSIKEKRDRIRSLILHSCKSGRVFTATFVKKDGTTRDMNCRLGVVKHLAGGESTTAHKDNLLTVYDMQSSGYRCINLDTVTDITISRNKVSFA